MPDVAMPSLTPYTRSEIGLVRDHNEDACYAKSWSALSLGTLGMDTLLIVADGMGGHQAGEWASQTAVDTVVRVLEEAATGTLEENLAKAVNAANKAIYQQGGEDTVAHPGTTLTIAALQDAHCVVAHVGDSRLYLLDGERLKQMTSDDSLVAEMVRQGKLSAENAATWSFRNQLTRAVGIAAEVEAAVGAFEVHPGEILLLCSDGLSGLVPDEEIRRILLAAHTAEEAGDALYGAAKDAGANDNVTVVLHAIGGWPNHPSPQVPAEPNAMGGRRRRRRERRWAQFGALLLMLLCVAIAVLFLFHRK